MRKKTVSLVVKLLVTFAILLFLFSKISFSAEGFRETLMGIDLPVYLLSLFGVIFVLGIKSYRWHILVSNEGFDYKPYRSFGAYMSSDAIGIVTPGRIGEIARLYYVRQETSISFYQAFKTIVSDRIFDFTMLGWFGISGLTFYFKTFGHLPGYIYTLIVLCTIVFAYIIGIYILGTIIRKNWFARWPIPGFIYDCFKAVVGKKTVQMWGITIIAYLAYFFFSWLILHSLSVKTGVVDVAFIMSIMSLSTIIPISIAGFGTREATLVALFSYYSLSPETAVSFSLLHFTAFFLWGGIIGLFYWLTMPISLDQVKGDSIGIINLFKISPKK
jgi:glycosyltransferase 2 family protein